MASKVDLPQPEGPEIDRYSPFLMCRWMPARACVSTSSVTNTFVTPSKLIKASGSFAMKNPLSIQTDAVEGILRRHIRQNYLIAHLQPVDYLDRVHRTPPQRHRHSLRFFGVGIQLEQRNLRSRLA